MGKVEASILWKGPLENGESLLAAISPDDPDCFEAELISKGESAELRIRVISSSLGQSRSSIDDILACLSASESGLASVSQHSDES
ncbi:MAG: hypothetical protein CMB67_01725 [Euryarchaeota archaeon]|nr:hypothetical protein [Euryarchaeota archaeon]